MSRLVVVVPLREGAYDEARRLLDAGPPLDLDEARFDRHDVYLTHKEVVFVFEREDAPATLELRAEDASLWRAAAAWRKVMRERPRTAETVYEWRRPIEGEGT